MIRYNTKTRLSIIMTLLMFVTFTLASVTLEAANNIHNAEGLAGNWSGIIKDKDIKTDFTITPSKDNNGPSQYSLHYGSPRTCRLEAEELDMSDSVITLKFNEANGGFCDRLYNGKMIITINDDDNLSVLVKSRSGDIEESADLKKAIGENRLTIEERTGATLSRFLSTVREQRIYGADQCSRLNNNYTRLIQRSCNDIKASFHRCD